MPLTSSVSDNNKSVQIRITGQFDFSLHQDFRNSYRYVEQSGAIFRVDLSQASYMDSSALGMLLLLKEHAEKLGGKVVLQKPNDSVAKILTIANFQNLMKIEL